METVEGIILVLSCQKHRHTRLEKFRLNKKVYADNWKVIYVLGDLFIKQEYKLYGDILTIKCEDSYIHLMKKLVMSMDILNRLFVIKQGILRAGDDLIFNEPRLEYFLRASKPKGILGWNSSRKSIICPNKSTFQKETYYSNFMVSYYQQHPEDFENPLHNLKGVTISNYRKMPSNVRGPSGVVYYLDIDSCKFVIEKMKAIDMDVFYKDPETDSYPYVIEDVGISYLLFINGIPFHHVDWMLHSKNPIAIHTNYLK